MKPLCGKTILITRGKPQAKDFSTKISELGGQPIEVPLLSFEYPSDLTMVEETFKRIQDYDWIVFTSKNGVEYFFKLLEKYHIPKTILDDKKFAVVGRKTKEALKNEGYSNAIVPKNFVAEGLIEQLKEATNAGERFLLARGNLARSVLPVELVKLGHVVTDLVLYQTVMNESCKSTLITLLKEKKIDVITFSSPSTIQNFVTLLDGTNWRTWIEECVIACIGPITEKKQLQINYLFIFVQMSIL